MTAIVLIGFMGAGKTTISKKLAACLEQPVIDMDEVLVSRLGCSINHYFTEFGEAAFREQETDLLKEALSNDAIIATGGGVILQKENQKVLQDQFVIYLKGQAEILIDRIRQDKDNIRPLAVENSDQKLKTILATREKMYEKLAKLTIETTAKTPEEIVKEIINQVG